MARDARTELEELRRVFREELDDHTTAMERDALTLARTDTAPVARRAAIAEIYRAAHSLKGAARAVEHADVEQFCHALEAYLGPARQSTAASVSLQIAQVAEIAARALRRWAEAPGSPSGPRERLLAEARRQIDQSARASPTPAPVPGAAPSTRSEAAPSPMPDAGSSPGSQEGTASRALETTRVSVERLGELLSASEGLLALSGQYADLAAGFSALEETLLKLRSELRRAKQALRTQAHAGASSDAGRLIDHSLSMIQTLIGWSIERERRDGAAWKAVAGAASAVAERARSMRLVRIGSLFTALERSALDASRSLGKDVVVSFDGAAVEIDRLVRDRLREPLLHLMRNAVDHGIESPEERARAGKPERGRVELTALLAGRELRVTLRDDGRGIDLDAVRAAAKARGIDVATAEPRALYALLFEPGFTTRASVTEISGRGIGLDVVRKRIAELQGRVEIESEGEGEGEGGTRFTLTVPIDLSVVRGLIVGVRDARLVLFTAAVARILRASPEDTSAVEGRLYLREEHGLTPLADLDEVLGLSRRGDMLADKGPRPCVVIAAGDRRAAFWVDALFDEREIVVQPLGPRVRRAAFVAGATVLSDGEVALVLDAADLVRLARPGRSAEATRVEPSHPRLLVVDDSITTRQLMRSILETAGYEVAVAADGMEAWERIESGELFDLVVSDIEMPRIDGLALLARVRSAARRARLPFVLVTALDSDVERRRALELGASAYVVKSGFDQAGLLDTLEQLL